MNNFPYYSSTVSKFFRSQSSSSGESVLDEVNKKIIYYLAKGLKTKDLPSHVHLSLSAVEKRKAEIVNIFGLEKSSVEEILKEAKKRGFI